MHLSPEDKLLEAVVKLNPEISVLKDINEKLTLITDWGYFTQKLIAHGSAPLFFVKLSHLSNASLIPTTIQAKLQQTYYKTLTRSMLLHNALKTVLGILQSEAIKVVVLKGAYLSQELYGDIALRQFSDIDILVEEENGLKAIQLLQQHGYVPFDPSVSEFIASQTEIVHYPPLVKNGVSVEVHIRLHRKSKAYAIDTAAMIQQAVAYKTSGIEAYGLSLYDLLVHLCVHIDKHFEGGEIQMKCFNDIVNLLLLKKEEINWSDFIMRTRLHKSEHLVFKYLLLTAEFYSIELPVHIITTYAPTLNNSDRGRFLDYLHCIYHKKYFAKTHWQNIREIKSFAKQVRYFLELIFPPKSFMISKYGLVSSSEFRVQSTNVRVSKLKTQNSKLQTENRKLKFWWLWYPYRWWVGLKGVFLLMRKKG